MSANWTSEARSLANEYSQVERKLKTSETLDTLIKNVWKDWRDMEHRRIEYFAPIKKDVVALRRLLSTLQNKLHGHGPGPRVGVGLPPPPKQRTEKDVADIQSILEHFENSLHAFKFRGGHDVDVMMEEVVSLERELGVCAEDMQAWQDEDTRDVEYEQRQRATVAERVATRQRSNVRYESDMLHYKRIGAIDSELAALGGRVGTGWDSRDHDSFLRVWTQLVLHNQGDILSVVRRVPKQVANEDEEEEEEAPLPNPPLFHRSPTRADSAYDATDGYPPVPMSPPNMSLGSLSLSLDGGHPDGGAFPPGSEDGDDRSRHSSGGGNGMDVSSSPGCTRGGNAGATSQKGSKEQELPQHARESWTLPGALHRTLGKRLILLVPGYSRDEIEAHIAWYLRHLQLLHEKKLLLAKWKMEKYNGNTNKLQTDSDINLLLGAGGGNDSGITVGGASLGSSRAAKADVAHVVDEAERERTRQRVMAWKAEKQRKQEEEKQQQELHKLEGEQRRYEQRRKHQSQTAAALQRYHDEEEQAREHVALAKAMSAPKRTRNTAADKAELSHRQQRDLELAKEKKRQTLEAEAKRNAQIAKEKNFEKWREKEVKRLASEERGKGVTANRSTSASHRSRITAQQLYMQQEKRSKAGAHAQKVGFGAYDLSRPSGGGGTGGMARAVPQWTQGARHVL